VILRDSKGGLVSQGANIPLTQILAGPKRPPVRIDDENEVQGYSSLLAQPAFKMRQPSQKTGWEALAHGAVVTYQRFPIGDKSKLLSVGLILVNHPEEQTVVLQPYRAKWTHLKVIHQPQFQTREGYSLEVTQQIAKERVPYKHIKFSVDLYRGGELTHGAVSAMGPGRWGIYVPDSESANFLFTLPREPDPLYLIDSTQHARHEGTWIESVSAVRYPPSAPLATRAELIQQQEEGVVVLDAASLASRSWTSAGPDLISLVQRVGVKSSRHEDRKILTGGETLCSVNALVRRCSTCGKALPTYDDWAERYGCGH